MIKQISSLKARQIAHSDEIAKGGEEMIKSPMMREAAHSGPGYIILTIYFLSIVTTNK